MSKQEQIDAFLLDQLADKKSNPLETELWVGLIQEGAFSYNPERKAFKRILEEPCDPFAPP